MEDVFEHLRCPMCGGELIYSEGTHDLCCVKNPYESMSAAEGVVESSGSGVEEAAETLHEERAGYGSEKSAYIYKVWGEGKSGRLKRNIAPEQAPGHTDVPITSPSPSPSPLEGEGVQRIEEAFKSSQTFASAVDSARVSDTPVESCAEGEAVIDRTDEDSAGTADDERASAAPVKRHGCVFAVSFTESARFGTLWSVRVVHGETNYFALMRLMQKIEKRRASGEPLAANAPHARRKRERSPAARLAFRFGIEEEDVYSIKFSSETEKRLAVFYGIPERDVRRIRKEEIEEE